MLASLQSGRGAAAACMRKSLQQVMDPTRWEIMLGRRAGASGGGDGDVLSPSELTELFGGASLIATRADEHVGGVCADGPQRVGVGIGIQPPPQMKRQHSSQLPTIEFATALKNRGFGHAQHGFVFVAFGHHAEWTSGDGDFFSRSFPQLLSALVTEKYNGGETALALVYVSLDTALNYEHSVDIACTSENWRNTGGAYFVAHEFLNVGLDVGDDSGGLGPLLRRFRVQQSPAVVMLERVGDRAAAAGGADSSALASGSFRVASNDVFEDIRLEALKRIQTPQAALPDLERDWVLPQLDEFLAQHTGLGAGAGGSSALAGRHVVLVFARRESSLLLLPALRKLLAKQPDATLVLVSAGRGARGRQPGGREEQEAGEAGEAGEGGEARPPEERAAAHCAHAFGGAEWKALLDEHNGSSAASGSGSGRRVLTIPDLASQDSEGVNGACYQLMARFAITATRLPATPVLVLDRGVDGHRGVVTEDGMRELELDPAAYFFPWAEGVKPIEGTPTADSVGRVCERRQCLVLLVDGVPDPEQRKREISLFRRFAADYKARREKRPGCCQRGAPPLFFCYADRRADPSAAAFREKLGCAYRLQAEEAGGTGGAAAGGGGCGGAGGGAGGGSAAGAVAATEAGGGGTAAGGATAALQGQVIATDFCSDGTFFEMDNGTVLQSAFGAAAAVNAALSDFTAAFESPQKPGLQCQGVS